MKALCLALVLVATPALAGRQEDAVRAAGREWVTQFKAGNLDALMALYAESPEVALHDQPKLTGREAVRGYFANRLKTPPDADFLLLEESLEVRGNTALMMSKYWFTLRAAGREFKDAGRSLVVYTRGPKGRWLIRQDIDQTSPDVKFPAPPEAR
jgi:ketosteroid isomerase-like protein